MADCIGAIGGLMMVTLIALLGGRFLKEMGVPADWACARRTGLTVAVGNVAWTAFVSFAISWRTGGVISVANVPGLWSGMLFRELWPYSRYIALLLGASAFVHTEIALKTYLTRESARDVLLLLFATPLGLYAFLPTWGAVVFAVLGAVFCAARSRAEHKKRALSIPVMPLMAAMMLCVTALALRWNP